MLLAVGSFLVAMGLVIFFGPQIMADLSEFRLATDSSMSSFEQIARRLDFLYVKTWPLAFALMAVGILGLLVRSRH